MSYLDMPLLPSSAPSWMEIHDASELLAADGGLTCPLWVQFLDPATGFPYFYNVQTHQRLWSDPDPDGELRCSGGGVLNTFPAVEGGPTGLAREEAGAAPSADNDNKPPFPPLPPGLDEATAFAAVPNTGGGLVLERSVTEELAEVKAAWWQRPARVQRAWDPSRTQYIEGSEEYNVWYGKYESDRFNPKEREPAPYRCDPELDSGWTQADLGGRQCSYFCVFFAKGCCSAGHRCSYYHHLPTLADANACDIAHDIFGRERFASHRDDMDGVGSFNSEGRTLFVADLRFDRSVRDTLQRVELQVREDFSVWGELESVRLIPTKAIAFVAYAHRAAAEFAKVAMANQKLGLSQCVRVKWASEDPNPRARKQTKVEVRELVDAAALRWAASLGELELATLQLTHQPSGFISVTAPYPDTSAQCPPGAKPPGRALIGPRTASEEAKRTGAQARQVEEEARRAQVAANVSCMTALLARIGAMHSSGVVEAADEL